MPVTPDIVDLARRASAGEAAAADELLRELEPLVVRTVRLVVGSGSWMAEDAAQDALLDIDRGIHSLRDPQAVKAWALRVAAQRAIKVSRRERLLSLRRTPELDPGLVAESGEPEMGRSAAIKAAFDLLSPRLRATAVLRLHAGLSEEETAEALGCSVGTVKSNLHDARRRLARALRERGFEPTTMPKEAT
ncbi:MAG: RNA polymerase sigma factor [Solirubrobacteraceae bacterium]